jgi:hypothetical protein
MYNRMKTIIYYLHRGDKIPFYVGKTKNFPNKREKEHQKRLNDSSIILEVIDSVDDWRYWEKHYITLFKNLGHSLTNQNSGGGGPEIVKESTKQKISQANKGTIHPIEGRISASNKLKGRKLPPEQVEKIRLAKTGKPNPKKGKPDGPKPGVSEAHKGRTSPNKGKGRNVSLYTVSGEYIKTYDSYYDLALNLNINPETVRCHLVGKANTICNKQYKVQYVLT